MPTWSPTSISRGVAVLGPSRAKLRQYYFVGGMPRVVEDFIDGGNDYAAARARQKSLLSDYDNDFSKHGMGDSRIDVERVRLAFRSIPAHLAGRTTSSCSGI